MRLGRIAVKAETNTKAKQEYTTDRQSDYWLDNKEADVRIYFIEGKDEARIEEAERIQGDEQESGNIWR